MEVFDLTLTKRDKNNPYLIPAILYGKGLENIPVAFDRKEFTQLVRKNGRNIYLHCHMPDGNIVSAIIKEIQKDVITFEPYHVDFLIVEKDQTTTITVPVKVINKENCLGMKNGGKMQHVLFKMTLSGKPENLPKEIVIDTTGLDIGTVIFTRDIPLEEGVQLVSAHDLKVMSVFSKSNIEKQEEEDAKAEKLAKEAAPKAKAEVKPKAEVKAKPAAK